MHRPGLIIIGNSTRFVGEDISAFAEFLVLMALRGERGAACADFLVLIALCGERGAACPGVVGHRTRLPPPGDRHGVMSRFAAAGLRSKGPPLVVVPAFIVAAARGIASTPRGGPTGRVR